MRPVIEFDGVQVFHGDCRDVLAGLPDNSVDSVVTDPPYELGFMGKKWDSTGIAYDAAVWAECLRVLKPGGHILAFGGTRTWHRLAVAIEDAGFEIRDNIAWIYGSGFPKSLDVSKAIDKKAGAEREVIGAGKYESRRPRATAETNTPGAEYGFGAGHTETAPATAEAEKWQGWGTALKPAHEPIVVGRKPLVGTVGENVLLWGTGGLNIDGSRIGTGAPPSKPQPEFGVANGIYEFGAGEGRNGQMSQASGRWPANVVFDEVTAGILDEQTGVTKSANGGGVRKTALGRMNDDGWQPKETEMPGYGDQGGASRFFYVAKASKCDRNEGLEELEERRASERQGDLNSIVTRHSTITKNFHPTVKPTALMQYLVKLVTPPGGTVLDPFTGSGSTGKAAILEGFSFIGVELTEEYLPIIEGRLQWAIDNREAVLF